MTYSTMQSPRVADQAAAASTQPPLAVGTRVLGVYAAADEGNGMGWRPHV